MKEKPYSASVGSDMKHCVEGPGQGFGYSAGCLWSERRLSSEKDAEAAAALCNEAYRQGYERALQVVRASLGIA